ncbi:MAG: MBL fold metallo-hydrolase [Chitinophagaceae bacterium]|nr:MBL fold metallo-hydrolase [Chitinophagaceae bacterium]MCB9045645.1 MBL fold metallo-hydrolase [Chitinophagales bacterium]
MLYTQSFVFNPFQENTYIIYNEKNQCWIIDPGMNNNIEISHFFSFIEENKLIPQAIINTHAHIDHIFGVAAVKDRYKIPFGLHEKDLPVLKGAAGSAMLFGFDFNTTPEPDFFIDENKLIAVGNDKLHVLFVPGHSPGSVAFYYPEGKWAIAGDVLFSGSIGRTDLPGGNHNQLLTSIRTQLFTLPGETVIFSGHGPATKVSIEQQSNPFLVA